MVDLEEMKEQQCFSSLKSQKKQLSQNAATVAWFCLRIRMSTQKIANLLGDADNESSKFAKRKWYVINNQNNTDYGEENEMVQPLNLNPKPLNQIFVIIQTHIFL